MNNNDKREEVMERLFHSIDLGRVVVLLVDMQDRFLDNQDKRKLIPEQVALLIRCKKEGIPVIIVECEGFGQTNFKLSEVLCEIPERKKITVVKPDEDAFEGTELGEILETLGMKTLLLMGVNACKCVYKTAVSARKLGYEILTSDTIVAGNCDEYEHSLHRNNLSRRRDCPDCGQRTGWYVKREAETEEYYSVLGMI
ncbi:MAG: isochorismatase family protein [Candidatus Moraniibacteriota bacterium]